MRAPLHAHTLMSYCLIVCVSQLGQYGGHIPPFTLLVEVERMKQKTAEKKSLCQVMKK